MLGKYEPRYIISCRELHENGKPHFHSYIIVNKKFNSVNVRLFDYKGNHPFIKKPFGEIDTWINYIKDEGNYLEYGKYLTKEEKRRNKNI